MREQKISKVDSWRTTDGTVHLRYEDARHCQARLDIIDVLDEKPLLGTYAGSYVEALDLLAWIAMNKDLVAEYIDALNGVDESKE